MNFSNREEYLDHRRKVHEKDVWNCEKCGKICKTNADWYRHCQQHEEKSNFCEKCGKAFFTTSELNTHKLIHMPKTIKCPIDKNCETMFGSQKLLKSHIRYCHSRKKEKIKCEKCPKEYRCKTTLKIHIKAVHLGEKPYKCNQCDYECAWPATMREHKETIHENIMFKCEISGCTKQMNRKANINKHMKTAHGIPLPNERNPPKKKIIMN